MNDNKNWMCQYLLTFVNSCVMKGKGIEAELLDLKWDNTYQIKAIMLLLYLSNTSENQRFPNVLIGYSDGTLTWNVLKHHGKYLLGLQDYSYKDILMFPLNYIIHFS